MNLHEVINSVLQNAGVDLGTAILTIVFFGSLIFYVEDYKRGLIISVLFMFLVAMLYNFLGYSMNLPIMLIIVGIVLLTISLYFSGRQETYS